MALAKAFALFPATASRFAPAVIPAKAAFHHGDEDQGRRT